MEIKSLRGTIKHCRSNQYDNSFYIFLFELTDPVNDQNKIWISFNSFMMLDFITSNLESTLTIEVEAHTTKNGRPFYNLHKIEHLTSEIENEIYKDEVMKQRLSLYNSISPFFNAETPTELGCIVIGTVKLNNLKRFNTKLDLQLYIVTEIADEYFICSSCDWSNDLKTVTKNSFNRYRYYYSDDYSKLYSVLSRFDFSHIVNSINRYLDTIQFRKQVIEEKEPSTNDSLRIFDYFSYRDQQRLTMRIGEFLKNEAMNWQLKNQKNSIEFVNTLNLLELSKCFNQKNDFEKLIKLDYKFKYRPSLDTYLKDIAFEIDYLLPKRYHKELALGFTYVSTYQIPGIRYQYPLNYIREHKAINRERNLNISFEEVSEITALMLKEHGMSIPNISSFESVEKILLFLIHDEESDITQELGYL